MKHHPKSSRRDPVSASAPVVGAPSNRRRFLKQSIGLGIAGVSLPAARAQNPSTRIKPHKAATGKKDHHKKRPKDLKESMEWDFERFVNEIVEQLRNGKTPKQIEEWIYPKDSKAANRQKVKTEMEGDDPAVEKDHPLGVCLVAPIDWKMEGQEVVGFTIRGRMGRKMTGEPLECDDYSSMDQTAAGGPRAAGSLGLAARRQPSEREHMLVLVRGGSSSSSSSSSSWPAP